MNNAFVSMVWIDGYVSKKMLIHIGWMAENYGKKDREGHALLPASNAKKIIRIIKDHGSKEILERCDECFRENEKLYKIWEGTK